MDRDGDRCRGDEYENTGSICAALCVDVGVEQNCYGESDRHENKYQWAGCARPLRRHPKPRQKAWD